jgi:hypothetical protein
MLQTTFCPEAFGYGMLGKLFQLNNAKGQATALLG